MSASPSPALTPRGLLYLIAATDGVGMADAGLAQWITAAIARGAGHGLLRLVAAKIDSLLPPAFAYFRDLAQRYVTAVCLPRRRSYTLLTLGSWFRRYVN